MRVLPGVLFAAFFSLFSPALFSMDWPLAEAVMTRNFGWNNEGMPHLGVSFAGEGTITTTKAGELLFQRREADTACRLPSPLGSWAAVDHEDGFISIYSRLDDESFEAIPQRVENGGVIGNAGVSGWASQPGLYFQFFDRKERRWVNPETLVGAAGMRQPTIGSVRLKNDGETVYNLPLAGSLPQGHYTVLANVITGSPAAPLAPYRISASLNGREAGALAFETYSVRDGSLIVYRNGLVPVRQVYAAFPGYEIADLWLTRGQALLEITALNISGTARSVVYRFTVE